MARSGYTLIEILIILMVVGLLLSLAGPSMSGMTGRANLTSAMNRLTADLHFARIQAIRTGRPARIQFQGTAVGSDSVALNGEYQVFAGTPEAAVKTENIRDDAPGLRISLKGTQMNIRFDSRGRVTQGATTFRFRQNNVSDSVALSLLGRVRRF